MEIKTVKVSNKGQISIPINIRELAGINKGDELLIVENNGKILLEKFDLLTNKFKDDFMDILKVSENSLAEVWDNDKDEIWNSYIKSEK